jgi:hypothetical protein
VNLAEVEETVLRLGRAFGAQVILDPYQGHLLGQRLQTRGLRVSEYPFSGESRRRLFGTVLQLVRDKHLRSYPHEELRRELLQLEVSETPSGWRVDHRRSTHDDHVVALGLAVTEPILYYQPMTARELSRIYGW